MNKYLTSKENLELTKINQTISSKEDKSIFTLLGATSKKLANVLEEEYLKENGFVKYTPKSLFILKDLKDEAKTIKVINLYDSENIKEICDNLESTRDFLSEYVLRIIFIFNEEAFHNLSTQCFEFHSMSDFNYLFIDHSYTFDKSQVVTNDKLDNALSEYRDYKKNKNQEPKTLLQLLFNIASEFHIISNSDMSLEYYKKALKITNVHKLVQQKSIILGNMGVIYQNKNELDLALDCYKQGLKISKEIGDLQGVSSGLVNIGVVYQNKNDFDLALEYYKDGLKICKDTGDLQGAASSLVNIGVIYQSRDDFDLALDCHKEALEIGKKIGDFQRVASGLLNIGVIYESKNDFHLALEYYLEGLETSKKIGDWQRVAISLGNIGAIYQNQNNFHLALEYHREALSISQEIGDLQQIERHSQNIKLINDTQ